MKNFTIGAKVEFLSEQIAGNRIFNIGDVAILTAIETSHNGRVYLGVDGSVCVVWPEAVKYFID